jgi:deltex-like protein
MNVMRAPNVTCAGHPKGSLWIRYVFHKGRQQSYHPNPGQRYDGTNRAAFLPDTPQGRQLCSRLVEAFQYGLTFRVGTSFTSGLTDQITWASIPHKTKLNSSQHGFPDPLYFTNCNEALDNLHVKRNVITDW